MGEEIGGIICHRWPAWDMAQKFAWVDGSQGIGAVQPAADGLTHMSESLTRIADGSRKQMTELGLSWSGPAAGSARDSLTRTTHSMERTSSLGLNGSDRILDYGRSYEWMRPHITYDNPENHSTIERGIDGLSDAWQWVWGASDDHVTIGERNQANAEAADRVLTEHEMNAQRAERGFLTAGDEPPPQPGPGHGGALGPGRSRPAPVTTAAHDPAGGPVPGEGSSAGPTGGGPSTGPDGSDGAPHPGPRVPGPGVPGPGPGSGPSSPQDGTHGSEPRGAGPNGGGPGTDRGPGAGRPSGNDPSSTVPRSVGPPSTDPPSTAPSSIDPSSTDPSSTRPPTGQSPWERPVGPGTTGGPDGNSVPRGPSTVMPPPGPRIGGGPSDPVRAGPGSGRSPFSLGPRFGQDLRERQLSQVPGRDGYRAGSPWAYGDDGTGRGNGRGPSEDGFRSGERTGPRSGARAPTEGGRPFAEQAGSTSRSGFGPGYAPMAGFGGGGRGDGREHRNRYQLTDSSAFEIDVVCSPAVLTPDPGDDADDTEPEDDR